MAKNRKSGQGKDTETPKPSKVVIYLEVDEALKKVMEELGVVHNRRLTGECIQALQEFAAKYGKWTLVGEPPTAST